MATIIDSLVVRLGMDNSEFKKGSKETDKSLKDTERTAASTTKQITKLLAVIGGTAAIKSFVSNMLDANTQMLAFSQNTRQSVQDVSAWSQAEQIAGGSGQGIIGTMDMLSKAQTELMLTGQSQLIPYFSALGISMAGAGGKAKPIGDLLLQLSDRFGHMDRATANNMGRMMGIDQDTMNLLLKGRHEVELMIARQKEYSAVTKQQAEASARLRSEIIESKQEFSAFGRELLTAAIPYLEKLLSVFRSVGTWMHDNKEFIAIFLGIVTAGLVAWGAALMTINLNPVIIGVTALAAAIALLVQDYMTWKRGGESFIDWSKWKPGIDSAVNMFTILRNILADVFYRLFAIGDMMAKVNAGDFSGARRALGEAVTGSPDSYLSGTSDIRGAGAGIPGASGAASAYSGVPLAAAGNSSKSVQTHIGEINVYSNADNANGIANDINNSANWLFTSQANSGMM